VRQRRIGGESAVHHNVGLSILDRCPRSQDAFALEPATLCDLLGSSTARVRDELNTNNVVFPKCPLSHEVERLGGDPLAAYSMVEPRVLLLGS
jgi:hypothetical protein